MSDLSTTNASASLSVLRASAVNGERRGRERRGYARRLLARTDAIVNALWGSRWNPLYHSGALTVALMAVLFATGLYLLLFYRLGDPYGSVARITEQAWTGRWIRGVHRFASDAAVVAIAFHALRMLIQRRTWGQRALAWMSGVLLLGTVLVCGWTGYVMVWDLQAQVLAVEGARFMDVLPLFSEPIGRSFVGERPLPSAFFFLNLFAHVALPVGLGLLLWIHVSRIARPVLLPPRGLLWGGIGLLVALAVGWPLRMAAPADLFSVPADVPLDLFYAFWLPLTERMPAWTVWAGGVPLVGLLLAVPWLTRPRPERRPAPSAVDERVCTGCEQCSEDCPYGAISMFARSDGREGLVARVDPDLCVSCGICAGSCAPMGVGPPGRTGRDQLSAARAFIAAAGWASGEVVVIGCSRAAAPAETWGVPLLRVDCVGNLHTSVIELLVRSGVGGVLVVSCPARDCWNREGAKWLGERVHNDREAELQARVDRRRVRLVEAGAGEGRRLRRELARYRADVAELELRAGEAALDEIERECEVAS